MIEDRGVEDLAGRWLEVDFEMFTRGGELELPFAVSAMLELPLHFLYNVESCHHHEYCLTGTTS